MHIKVHGGTTADDLRKHLEEAEKLAKENYEQIKDNITPETSKHLITAILFFDEANTTEDVGLIKEIMCDLTCMGRRIDIEHGLKIIAAVNPYRKHSREMIEKLESAGLGFYVSASDTKERLGHIPMRQLVYRVQPLPTSLLPLVWDFGQLDKTVENVYIKELIRRSIIATDNYDLTDEDPNFMLICDLLDKSQQFMRSRNDECSFVSIRNVERVIKVTKWFLNKQDLILTRMTNKKLANIEDYTYESKLTPLHRAFVLSLIVCYHSSLYNNDTRREYRQMICDTFELDTKSDWVFTEMLKCQNVFFDEIDLNKKNIACNLALFENVFMMIICIELRIPLFIVGKPGSSKSLAKTIVSRAMEGRNSKSELFQNLKEAYFVNFQCSPLTTSDMILKAFQEAAKFQESVDIEKSVAVVNLDEIGLAEGSESMPLKALHPLLESGTDSTEENVSEHHKVAVIGISNWALDPAKMNRGLFVSRGEPDINELIETAKGICRYDINILTCIEPFIKEIAEAYLELCSVAREFKREFFGLRDYYSLIKMIYYFCSRDQMFTWSKLEHAVKRNFSGLEIDNMQPFRSRLYTKLDKQVYETDPKCEPINLVESALKGEYVESNSRYLLFLTENNSAIDIIQNYLTSMVGVEAHNLSVIFGSSFRLDQQYTEVCRNISLIKHSMEIGKTIILLNSYNLYESLYDALNQYYYEFAGQKYVDLGLGTHRIKCSVHDSFRLIIIAEKSAVYDSKRFPIPLINRLEKHFLNASTMLNKEQNSLVEEIHTWIKKFSQVNLNEEFVGFHSDTIASLVLHFQTSKTDLNDKQELINKAKKYLLRCATPDSIIRSNASRFLSQEEKDFVWNEYFSTQKHLCLKDLLNYHLNQSQDKTNLIQITTNSKSTLLNLDLQDLSTSLNIDQTDVCLLQSFDTQQQFLNKLKQFYSKPSDQKNLLLIQSDMNLKYSSDLIACARHHIAESFKSQDKNLSSNFYVCLLILIPKESISNFIGFQFGYWSCYHLDEIEDYPNDLPPFEKLKNKSLSSLLQEALDNSEPLEEIKMETEEFSETKTGLNLSSLFKKLAHNACSLIVDTNLTRTIHRIDLFIKLCEQEKYFVQTLAKRLINLQKQKENEYIRKEQSLNWLISQVATKKQISQYSTLRRACQNYFETKLSPLLAYILSYIDMYSNLDTLYDSLESEDSQWKVDLWLRLFENEDLCKLDYKDMRTMDYSSEVNSFNCQSEWIKKEFTEKYDENKNLKPSLPFFWILINQLNNLYKNFSDSYQSSGQFDLGAYARTISRFFEENSLYLLLDEIVKYFNEISGFNFSLTLKDYYINDFLLINCKISSRDSLELLKNIFKFFLNNLDTGYLENLKFSLPMTHYVFDKYNIKNRFEIFLKFSAFESRITEASIFNEPSYFTEKKCMDLDLDSCLQAILSFKQNFAFSNEISDLDSLLTLLKLISELWLTKLGQSNEKLEIISENFQALTALKYFCDLIRKVFDKFEEEFRKNDEFKYEIIKVFNEQIKLFNSKYFVSNTNFKNLNTIQNFHEFVVVCYQSFKNSFNSNKIFMDFFEEYLNNFYLDAIESLCFDQSSSLEPNNDTIDFILKSMTDKKLTLDSAYFELKPIYLSLLLQIVFKNYNDNLISHLNKWFNSTSFIGQNEIFRSGEEFAILFQNCVFDQYVSQFTKLEICLQLDLANKLALEIVKSLGILERILAERKIMGKTYAVNHLLILAKLKFCISVLTRFSHSEKVYESVKNLEILHEFNSNMHKIVEFSLSKFASPTKTVINYLIKDLIRKYGSSSIKYVLSNPTLAWMAPKEIIGDNQSVTDRFVLMGFNYLKCKKAILTCFTVKNVSPLQEIFSQDCDPKDYAAFICTALYQNITLLYKNLSNLTSQIADIFNPFVHKHFANQKDLLKSLLENNFSNCFKVNEANWPNIDLTLLLVQIKYTVLFCKSDLILPLRDLLLEPSTISEKYLPTMPQDNLYDVKIAMNPSQGGGDNNRFYTCPNGHIYVIGNCGRPWIKDKCKECGEIIGGESHKLVDSNKAIDESIQDKTMKGYCISEDPTQVNSVPSDIRLLDSKAFHLERFFLNACMYLSCGDNDENLEQVKSAMCHEEKDIKGFFWKHMKNDLNLVCKSMNLTLDESILLLHSICFGFLHRNTQIEPFKWNNKQNRQQWEDLFNRTYLKSFLERSSEALSEANLVIKEESAKSGEDTENQSKMYFMAYELVTEDQSKLNLLYENEKFWKYRPNISFDLMSIEFLKQNENRSRFPVVAKFIEINNQLQILVNLSQIVRLVKYFQSILTKSIFKHVARNKSIKEFLDSITLPREWSKNQIEQCVNSFQNIWSYSKQRLNDHIRSNISQDLDLNVSFTHKYDMNTSLSFFLPTMNGDGFLCYSLIHYLCHIQNDMLNSYHYSKKIRKIECKQVDLFDNKEFLITFDKNSDLLRLVQSNFSYDSKNLQFIFRYSNIEHQIIDKYLRSKPKIELNTIPLFEYSDEIGDLNVFRKLNNLIKQSSCELALQIEIIDEFEKVSELSEALNTLKIIINYAIATSERPNEYISSFVRKIYTEQLAQQAEQILKTKIIENCKMENLKLIWILLMMKRSILQTKNEQDPFENLNTCFKQSLDLKLDLEFDKADLFSITVIFYQIITFVLTSLQGDDLQSYNQIKIQDMFISLSSLDPIVLLDKYRLPNSLAWIGVEDNEIKMESVYEIWKKLCSNQLW